MDDGREITQVHCV